MFLAPVKGNQVCISLFLCPQKWRRPSTVRLQMTECPDFKWNDMWLWSFAKLAPLRLHFYPMCHVATCALQRFFCNSTSYAGLPRTNSGRQSASVDGHALIGLNAPISNNVSRGCRKSRPSSKYVRATPANLGLKMVNMVSAAFSICYRSW